MAPNQFYFDNFDPLAGQYRHFHERRRPRITRDRQAKFNLNARQRPDLILLSAEPARNHDNCSSVNV